MGRTDEMQAPPPNFSADIKPLFRERDRRAMTFLFDLWDYEAVKENADAAVLRDRAGRAEATSLRDDAGRSLTSGVPVEALWPPQQVASWLRASRARSYPSG
jgi:hypothetical protein